MHTHKRHAYTERLGNRESVPKCAVLCTAGDTAVAGGEPADGTQQPRRPTRFRHLYMYNMYIYNINK